MHVPPAWHLSSPACRDGPELTTKSSCSPELTWLPDGSLRNAGCASLLPDIYLHQLAEIFLNWTLNSCIPELTWLPDGRLCNTGCASLLPDIYLPPLVCRDGGELTTESSGSTELTWFPDDSLFNAGCASLVPDICLHQLVEMVLNWPDFLTVACATLDARPSCLTSVFTSLQRWSWTDLTSWRWHAQRWMRVPPAWHLFSPACRDGPELTTKSSCSPVLTWLPNGTLRNAGCATLLPDIYLHQLAEMVLNWPLKAVVVPELTWLPDGGLRNAGCASLLPDIWGLNWPLKANVVLNWPDFLTVACATLDARPSCLTSIFTSLKRWSWTEPLKTVVVLNWPDFLTVSCTWHLSSPACKGGPELTTKSNCSPELTWLPDGGLRNARCASLLPDICLHQLAEMVLNWQLKAVVVLNWIDFLTVACATLDSRPSCLTSVSRSLQRWSWPLKAVVVLN